jgi:hypothetical protein
MAIGFGVKARTCTDSLEAFGRFKRVVTIMPL